MDQPLFIWLSVIVVFALGTLAHFLYDLSHQNKILGLFTAVNESTWEHVKIAITPTLLWSLVDGFLYGNNPNYFTAKLASLLILTFFIPLVFYSYTRATKKPFLPLDITIFLVAIILAQLTFTVIINQPAIPYWAIYLSAIGCFIFFGAYMTLTLMPLKQTPFKDPITGQYGFRAHRNFFKKKIPKITSFYLYARPTFCYNKNRTKEDYQMENTKFYRTAESVSPKHPDKLCDQISDAILDAYLEKDPDARVAAETCGGHDVVFVTGEITSKAKDVDIEKIVHRIAGDDVEVHTKIVKQSPEIAQGVDTGGAGDQGIMIGYATDETPEMLPREVVLSRALNEAIYKKYPYDGKTQVTIAPDGSIDSIVASFQNVDKDTLQKEVEDFIKTNNLKGRLELHINPAGDWHQGGFDADTGLTGRKLIVDNYGPAVAIGGGCYSGKDPSKVDRSAAYMARRIAVDYLKKRHAHEVLVRLAYAIGYAEPLEKTVIIDGKPEEIEGYDLTPCGIIKYLDLKRPIYEETARYGHYGHAFPWDN